MNTSDDETENARGEHEEIKKHTYNTGIEKYKWNSNIKVQMHAYNQTWYRVPELMRTITEIRRLNFSRTIDRDIALAFLDGVSMTLEDIGVSADERFPQNVHVICEDIGVWSSFFLKLRYCMNASYGRNELNNKDDKSSLRHDCKSLYETLENMIQHLSDLNYSMNQKSFETFFNLSWAE